MNTWALDKFLSQTRIFSAYSCRIRADFQDSCHRIHHKLASKLLPSEPMNIHIQIVRSRQIIWELMACPAGLWLGLRWCLQLDILDLEVHIEMVVVGPVGT